MVQKDVEDRQPCFLQIFVPINFANFVVDQNQPERLDKGMPDFPDGDAVSVKFFDSKENLKYGNVFVISHDLRNDCCAKKIIMFMFSQVFF